MAIEFNGQFSKSEDFEPIKPGKYEVFIEKTDVGTTASGFKRLRITYRIRNDVKQDFQNRVIWETLWLDKREEYAKEGWFDLGAVEQILFTQPNPKTEYNSMDEVLVDLKDMNMIIEIENSEPRYDERKGVEVVDSVVVKYSHEQSKSKNNVTEENTDKFDFDSIKVPF